MSIKVMRSREEPIINFPENTPLKRLALADAQHKHYVIMCSETSTNSCTHSVQVGYALMSASQSKECSMNAGYHNTSVTAVHVSTVLYMYTCG